MNADPIVELKRHIEVLSREIYGDWQKADNPGLRQRVAQIERIVAQVEEQYKAMTRALEDEERARQLEAARREGTSVAFSRGKEIITLLTGGGVMYIFAWIWRQLAGG